MARYILSLALAAELATAFPWVASSPGVDSSLLFHRAPVKRDDANCPFNPNHKGAAPYTAQYPYTGAKNGLPGTGVGGIKVPADGDTAHYYTPPGSGDIRGPCPGLNAAANHNFLSHDGITTFTELVDAQQNLYNIGYDLAVTLATLGVSLDGDIVTGKLSIGCDATSRTSLLGLGSLLGSELGLNGHNKFEGDTSLTRNDYFLSPARDDYNFNGTLFGYMQKTCNGNFNRENLALYRYQRYQQSIAENGNFYYGPKALLLYGAASFLYELFPSFGPAGNPDLPTIESFFGAAPDGNGGWNHIPERIPPNWYNRKTPYSNLDVGGEILAQYALYPVLFGGNIGQNNFDALGNYGSQGQITGGKLTADANALRCLLFQISTENVPSSLSGVLTLPVQILQWAVGKLNVPGVFGGSGCPGT
ncbi:hypothetical protein MMC30_005619 [Trapelia coarctata]|nr:hypothetical protein [Trapelia coarctata]